MRIRLLSLAPLLLLGVTSLHAATIYVDGRHSRLDTDGKSWSTAFTSVQAALQTAASGDEVWVASGVYNTSQATLPDGVRLYGGFIGTETFRDQRPGLPGLTVLMAGPQTGPVLKADNTGPATRIDGFTLASSGWSGTNVLALTKSRLTVAGCIITYRPPADSGPAVFSYGAGMAMVTIAGGAPVFVNNIFTDSPGDAFKTTDAAAVLVNNTIAGNGLAGVECAGPALPTLINNIIAFNQTGVLAPFGIAPVMKNNCFHENTTGDFSGGAAPVGKDGNIAADPRFASYELGNLHIQPDSPCVDAGAEEAAQGDLDIDLLPRVMGARADIGADESDGRRWEVRPRIVRVSPLGNDANDGTAWDAAKQTVPAAVNAAAITGGEVWVAAGTYAMPLPAQQPGAILLPSHVSLYGGFAGTETRRDQRDWGRNPTMFTLAAPGRGGHIVTVISGHRTSRVDGFLLLGSASTFPTAGIQGLGASPVIANSVLTGLSVEPQGGAVVDVTGGSPLVYNTAIVNNASGKTSITQFTYSAPTFSHCVLSGNAMAYGSLVMLARGQFCAIENCLIQGNSTATSGPMIGGGGATLRLVNNTVVGNGMDQIFQPARSITMVNNVFSSNRAGPAGLVPGRDTIRNNCFYPAGLARTIIGKDGNIEAYPGFADLRTGDYRPRADSPCVDAGDDSVVQPGEVDLDGNPRLQGRHVDMGAFEFAGAASAPVLPDVAEALKIAAGLQAATPENMRWLDPDTQTKGISIEDAVLLLKVLQARAGSME